MVFHLFFSKYLNPSMYVNHEFLNYTQALEMYHRMSSDFTGIYVSEKLNKGVKDHMIQSLTSFDQSLDRDYKSRIISQLKLAFEYSQRKRFKEIYNKFNSVLELSSSQVNKMNNKIIEGRNYLTHLSMEGKKKKLDSTDLYYANLMVRFYVIMGLLSIIKFSDDDIRTVIENFANKRGGIRFFKEMVKRFLNEEIDRSKGESE